MMFGLIILIIALVFLSRRQDFTGMVAGTNTRRDPLDILRERYAKGEISDDEFRERKQALLR